jgi:UTP--glucose-1-phosphate uridylyltransferase
MNLSQMLRSSNNVNTVVIPVAGLGTRLLPATKAVPKEMLPIVNKPIIQIIMEEIEDAGFKKVLFITHSSKNSIENHFDKSFELEATLEKRIERALLKEIRSVSRLKVSIQSIRQGETLGLGHAVLCAKPMIENMPFAVVLPDMLIKEDLKKGINNLRRMREDYSKSGDSSILLSRVSKKDISKYGIVKFKHSSKTKGFLNLTGMVEKPNLNKAPSNLFATGRYIFNEKFMSYLEKTSVDKHGEIQLTRAINSFIKNKNNLKGFMLEGKLFDCGDKLGYAIANFEYAKTDKEISKDFIKYLKNNTK